jgi:hypothetical protein
MNATTGGNAMRFDFRNYEVDAISDLVCAGRNEDGEKIQDEAWYVRATDAAGRRVMNIHFRGRNRQGELDAAVVVARIRAAERVLDPAHWEPLPPVYGSTAYVEDDGEGELREFEAELDRQENW